MKEVDRLCIQIHINPLLINTFISALFTNSQMCTILPIPPITTASPNISINRKPTLLKPIREKL